MAKYSTGGADGGRDAGACELCGKTTEQLQTATVEGATLSVCPDCASLGEESAETDAGSSRGDGSTGETRTESRQKRAARNAARAYDAASGDSTHWEEHGTNYDRDQLPYLVSGYGEKVTRARQDSGFQREELAEAIGVDENDLLAIEQERAIEASVGGSVIRALEERLDIELADE